MGMEADWRRIIMTRDGAAIMKNVGLERRRMRQFGESEERSYGGIREEDFGKRVVRRFSSIGSKGVGEMHSKEWSVGWMKSIVG